jgi:hypothetical protein
MAIFGVGAQAQGGGGEPPPPPPPALRPDSLQSPNADSAYFDRLAKTDSTTAAQRAHADSVHADSMLKARAMYHPDTLRTKARLAHAEVPELLDIGHHFRWNRDELMASGALTLADLVDEVPGITGFRVGWISSPALSAYNGNVARVRVFYDGIELDALDPRLYNQIDLATIQLFTLEEVAIERGAGELRIYCRSWRVDKVTPYTQADVITGTESTNYYRGYFGTRLPGGAAIQVAANQYDNTGAFGGGGGQTTFMLRAGWASGKWSFDGFANRYIRGRDSLTGVPDPDFGPGTPNPAQIVPQLGISDLESNRTDAYLRGAYGDPDGGLWAQLVAATMSFKNSSTHLSSVTTDTATADSIANGLIPAPLYADSLTSESQYIASGGFTRWGLHFSATDRLRVFGTQGTYNSPSARVGFEWPFLSASLFLERNALSARALSDSSYGQKPVGVNTEELTVQFTPLPFFSLLGGATEQSSDGSAGAPPTSTTLRGEAGLRLSHVWLTVGVLTQDTALLAAPLVYDSLFAPEAIKRSTAVYASIDGRIYKALSIELWAMHWNDTVGYRPQNQANGYLTMKTEWLSRFPRHTFSVKARVGFEYRSQTEFPLTAPGQALAGVPYLLTNPGFSLNALLEIHVLQGTLTYQLRNGTGYNYWTVPGYIMPRTVNIYGIRWSFWN